LRILALKALALVQEAATWKLDSSFSSADVSGVVHLKCSAYGVIQDGDSIIPVSELFFL
jgi:hypothetical protein